MALGLTSRVGTEISGELAALAERVRAGVVQIKDGRGAGSGTIWSPDGLIVTNHHVAPGERARVTTTDGLKLEGRAIASLPERDLAILQVDARGLPALPVGDSGALRIGELVAAVGHPLGVPNAMSLGIFSGVGPIEGRGGRHFQEAILADIELRPGNSGGPLVNARGEVVGINAMVLGPRTALAVPSATVIRLLGNRTRRTLGVQVAPVVVRQLGAAGRGLGQEAALIVLGVAPESPADRAGLLPGDILLALGGHALDEPGDLAWGLTGPGSGGVVTLRLLRGGQAREVAVTPEAQGRR